MRRQFNIQHFIIDYFKFSKLCSLKFTYARSNYYKMAKPDSKTWLVVGASRGIGLELCRQLVSKGDAVIGTVRDAEAPWNVGDAKSTTTKLVCDVSDNKSISEFAEKLSSLNLSSIDYAVINAGVLRYPNRTLDMSFDTFATHLHTNTIGPIITAQKLLQTGIQIGTIAFMSSDSGSTQLFRDQEDGFAAYAASKAALNQALRHMAAELKRKGSKTVILALHPGEVLTDMANIDVSWEIEGGQMSAEESVRGLLDVIPAKGLDQSGTFWTWDNREHPW
ncbi:putative short-chain dehydrogenase [Xylogone sp. PMI_703]|nr:putative short-chain dehydrogenase [Xylogone sp. PMI_703]